MPRLQLALTSAVTAPIAARLVSAVRMEHAAADRASWDAVVRLQATGVVALGASLSEWGGARRGPGHARAAGSYVGGSDGGGDAAAERRRSASGGGGDDDALAAVVLTLATPLARARFELLRRAARLPALLPKARRRAADERRREAVRAELAANRRRLAPGGGTRPAAGAGAAPPAASAGAAEWALPDADDASVFITVVEISTMLRLACDEAGGPAAALRSAVAAVHTAERAAALLEGAAAGADMLLPLLSLGFVCARPPIAHACSTLQMLESVLPSSSSSFAYCTALLSAAVESGAFGRARRALAARCAAHAGAALTPQRTAPSPMLRAPFSAAAPFCFGRWLAAEAANTIRSAWHRYALAQALQRRAAPPRDVASYDA